MGGTQAQVGPESKVQSGRTTWGSQHWGVCSPWLPLSCREGENRMRGEPEAAWPCRSFLWLSRPSAINWVHLHNQGCVLPQAGGHRSKVKALAGPLPLEVLEGSFLLLPASRAACTLGHFMWLSYRDPCVGLKAHPDPI